MCCARVGYVHSPGRRQQAEEQRVSSESKQALNGLKVLVIDDSKTIRRTAETLLSKEGCKVFTAEMVSTRCRRSRTIGRTSSSSTS
jgi:PleD family two-component response regulator